MFSRAGACLAFMMALLAGGCGHATHKVDVAQELHTRVSSFTQSRDRVMALVTESQRSLDPASLNQLTVSYAALQARGNGYAGFLVESVSVVSFDVDKNNIYAANLKSAIEAFNRSYLAINSGRPDAPKLSTVWIPMFADSVKKYWERYHNSIAAASPQVKANMLQQLKRDTVWPNFEDIAPQPLIGPAH
jgi:hypothetical protein